MSKIMYSETSLPEYLYSKALWAIKIGTLVKKSHSKILFIAGTRLRLMLQIGAYIFWLNDTMSIYTVETNEIVHEEQSFITALSEWDISTIKFLNLLTSSNIVFVIALKFKILWNVPVSRSWLI